MSIKISNLSQISGVAVNEVVISRRNSFEQLLLFARRY